MTANNTVSKRRLGRTDIEVTPIGLGVMQFSGGGRGFMGRIYPELTQEQKTAIVKTALDGGINWFDTAELYGFGTSEESLSTALKTLGVDDNNVVVATKWFPIFRTAKSISKTIHDRIRFLDGYTIDNYMVHQPWGFSSIENQMAAMADLVEVGLIRSVGVSNFNEEQMRRAHAALAERGLPLAVNQMHYSLLQRKIETNGVLDTAKELGVTIVAYTPLANGLLSGKYHKDPGLLAQSRLSQRVRIGGSLERSRPVVRALEEIASQHGVTPAQVALNWLIYFHGDTVVAIPGATKTHQVEESAGTMRFRLSLEEMTRLDELSQGFR